MEMMERGIIPRRMALKADIITCGAEFKAVGFVAVAASHSLTIHMALDKRTVLVYLTLDLAVRKIKVFTEESDSIVITNGLTMYVVFANLSAARVTSCAHLDFAFGRARCRSMRFTSRRISRPSCSITFVQRDC